MTETTEIVLTIGAILLLLVLSAFFSGSETALTAASRARMHQAARQGNKHADMVLALIAQRDRLIGGILLGNNLVNILASALATSLLLQLVGETGVVYATLLMTMLVLIFAEVLPKTYALVESEKVALIVAPTIRFVITLFSPVVSAVQFIVGSTLKAFGVEISHEISTELHEEELRGVIELHEGEDPEIQQERSMLRSILELDDVEVGEIMTHRRNVVMLDLEKEVGENVDAALESPFTRLPVYQGDSDNIVGVLHAKALLREIRAHSGNVENLDLSSVASDPWFIPDSTSLLDQLEAFKKRREHFAVVVDEYGTFMGIVTLEDILEEIVGEITDEFDVDEEHPIKRSDDGHYVVEGAATIRDLNRATDWSLPDEEANTVAGLVIHEAQMIPTVGQVFSFHGFRFEVLERDGNRITKLKIRPL